MRRHNLIERAAVLAIIGPLWTMGACTLDSQTPSQPGSVEPGHGGSAGAECPKLSEINSDSVKQLGDEQLDRLLASARDTLREEERWHIFMYAPPTAPPAHQGVLATLPWDRVIDDLVKLGSMISGVLVVVEWGQAPGADRKSKEIGVALAAKELGSITEFRRKLSRDVLEKVYKLDSTMYPKNYSLDKLHAPEPTR